MPFPTANASNTCELSWDDGLKRQDKVPAEHKGAKNVLLIGVERHNRVNRTESGRMFFAAMNSLWNRKDLSSLKSHQLRLRASV